MKILYESKDNTVGFCLCPNCYNFTPRAYRYPFGQFKPCRKCDSVEAPIEIDEMIAQTIILLNEKGYLTKACCSGHLNGHDGYIAFWKGMSPDLEKVPNFIYRLDCDFEHTSKGEDIFHSNVIRWQVKGATMLERLEDLLEKHKMLYEWVEGLNVRGE